MATVKFSGELRDNIIRNAEALFRDKIQAAEGEYDNSWGDRSIDLAYASFIRDVQALPKEWFNWADEANCNMLAGVKLDSSIKLKFSKPVPLPVTALDKGEHAPIAFARDGYYQSSLSTHEHEMFADIRTEVVAYKNKITMLVERKNKFVNGVKELIYAHSTLAPALKAWPPLMDLLPDATKARHLAKVERNTKEDIQLAADLNALTATIVASKIGGV